jgi:hypothetical protein
MIKKNSYSKKQSKKLNYKNIKLTNIQELISESSVLLKKGFIRYVDPSLLIQSLRQFIKLVRKIKHSTVTVKGKLDVHYRAKPILLYSENKYTRQLLNLALEKLKNLSSSKVESSVEVGGIKQLISSTKKEKKYALVIFIENPTVTNVDFCINNRIYIMSMFINSSLDSLKGNYKVPLVINTLKRYFWLVTLLELI